MKNYQDVNDIELINEIKQDIDHCDEAFQELYRRYQKLVLFVAKRTLHSDSDAQDIMQETFIEIRRSITKLRNPQYFRLWLYRVISSRCKDLYRSHKFSIVDCDHEGIQNAVREERMESIPEKHMKFTSDQEVLLAFMDELPEGQSMVLTLFYMEQRSIKEIAELLDIPEGTVKSRMSSAKSMLKQRIERYERLEQTRLSFHSLDEAVLAALLYGLSKTPAIPYGAAIPKTHTKLKLNQINPMKFVAALSIGGVVVGSGVYAYTQYKQANQTLPQNSYEPIVIEGVTISSTADAYFYLLQKACCEEEIKRMDQKELQDLKELYISIKKMNGFHYHLLETNGWSKAYEEKVSCNE